MRILSFIQLFFPLKSWGSKEEIWDEELIEEEAFYIEGLGYVFKENIPGGSKSDMDEGEFCYIVDRLRDVHACICKNGGVQQVGRRLNPVTNEPECAPIQIEITDDNPYTTAARSKVRQINPSKLRDLSSYCK